MAKEPMIMSEMAKLSEALPEVAFQAPWQARAFAMAVALHERGAFTWQEWAEALASHIRLAQGQGDPDTGSTYYDHWLKALEKLVAEKSLAPVGMIEGYRRAWAHSASRTPHGRPIELSPADFHERDH